MNREDELYRDLQRHLDRQTIGFPKTESGSDIQLLKQLFRPDQAEVAMILTYRFESLEQIHARARHPAKSREETERLLDETAAKGVIGHRKREGVKQYRNIPYVVGMIEAAAQNPTPELAAAHTKYSEDGLFWRSFLGTKVPQMRTIPVGKSITPMHHIGTYDEIKRIIETTDGPIAIFPCVCRSGAEKSVKTCKQTSRKETCMALRDGAQNVIGSVKAARQIGKQEALDILQKNQDDGLVLQPSNSQAPDFICSCCGCCCGLMQLHKAIPNPISHWATNFFAVVNPELCTGCELCGERCQAGALKLDSENTRPAIDLGRCLGCGLCVVACPEGAIELRKKAAEIVPPRTGEEMMEVIMANKQ